MADEVLTRMVCGECGIVFAMPEFYRAERQQTGKGWYCPNGHSRVYRESDADKFKRERDNAVQQLARAEDERRAAEARAYKAEASERRLKKRASAGVCPCCNRTFQQLARHMTSKHPTFKAEAATVVPIKGRKRS